ncbi:anti-sigma factor domain-containing protein [Pseudomonas sp. nanlin1]|uniref:anti-sigma factor n=1 Tax=Pseudomonas sp. nanlin1 TaxID=3040605 RepID=UPI003890DB90
MKQSDAELNELAGEYVLGTLSADQRAQVQQRLAHEPELAAAVQAWEAHLLPLTAMVEPLEPSAHLWQRIQRSLSEAVSLPRQPTWVPWWQRLALWRGLAGGALAACVVLAALLLVKPAGVPGNTYVVVLVGPQDKAPGWVVQASERNEIQLIPLGDTPIPADKALQFWTKADDWQAPVSLGLVKPGQSLSVAREQLPPLQADQLFELTLEAPQGSPTGKPTGAIQFIGRAVKVI